MATLSTTPRERFAEFVREGDEDLDLARGAFLLCTEEYPDLDVESWIAHLDELGRDIAERLAPRKDPLWRLEILRQYLFRDFGLRGNTENYYDPRNSYLCDVLERKRGIPISLSVVTMLVGKRAGLGLEGVAFPSHFLVKCPLEKGALYLDPFNGGRLLTAGDCELLLEELTGGRVPFRPEHLEAASARQILLRMLRNLKAVYLKTEDKERALSVVERLLLLAPGEAGEYRDRGLLHFERGAFGQAVADLERYLARSPDAPDRNLIAARLQEARGKAGGHN